MTIATPGTNTCVQLNWTIDKFHEKYVRHFATHAGWTFTVRSREGGSTLTATHTDGRSHESEHVYAVDALDSAIRVMHPSEAMAWLSEDVPMVGPVHTASWGHLYFAARSTVTGERIRFGYRVDGDLSDTVLVLDTLTEAKEVAADVLIDHYGPLRPVVDHPLPSDSQSPAERLSVAFSAVPGLADVDAEDITQALGRAGLRLADVTPLHRGAADPVTRLSRALYSAHMVSLGYDDVTELLRRAGLTLS